MKMKNILVFFLILIFTCSCNKASRLESKSDSVNLPTYFVQLYIKDGSSLATNSDRKFGKLDMIKVEFVTNDSSAYVYAFKLAELIRGEDDLFSSVNEFKLYNEKMEDITNSIYFSGIELYPNTWQ
jgi:hypothetical protein